MKPFAEKFYKSPAWKNTSAAYAKSQGYLCELCWAKGSVTPGEIVHHKIHITPDNIDDPSITLNWDNLQLLCRKHHALIHGAQKRFYIDENGHAIALDLPPFSG